MPLTPPVIGGLVDHKPKPGVSESRAARHSVRCARLPLDEYLSLRKPALTCLAVFQILNGFVATGDWGRVVREAPAMSCAPMRKYVHWKQPQQIGKQPQQMEGNTQCSDEKQPAEGPTPRTER